MSDQDCIGPLETHPDLGKVPDTDLPALFRIHLYEDQAMLLLPRYGTYGIGFEVEEVEEDCNQPYTLCARDILARIRKNIKYHDSLMEGRANSAILLLQNAITKYLRSKQ